MRFTAQVILVALFAILATPGIAAERPNIILIMCDDMGYSDLGCYGSEIDTPNLDRLASGGLRLTQFHNTGRCCPTRASLMTGLYPHQAGMGHMTGDAGPDFPGYRGRLLSRCVTIGEVLQAANYRTIVTGKWHLGAKDQAWWPHNRGFDRVFAVPAGGGFYHKIADAPSERTIVLGEKVRYSKENDVPDGFYATDAWTEQGIAFARQAIADDKPFFWYLPFNAPHWPLHAKPADIAKYEDVYKVGWDEIREKRLARMVELGIIHPDWKLTDRPKSIPPWENLAPEQQNVQTRRMAVYAGMIDCVDQNVGKIVTMLRQADQLENTIILFLQDNGGCAEGGSLGSDRPGTVCGASGSFPQYGECWANASNTPFRRYKHWVHEGGTATPLVVHWPAGIDETLNGSLVTEPAHLIDLMATCVDVSGAEYPTTYAGNAILPLEGRSLRPMFRGEPTGDVRPLFFEHEGNCAVRLGKWKLVATAGRPWELYDMDTDRTETTDLAATMPERVQEMAALWQAYAERALVYPKKGQKKK